MTNYTSGNLTYRIFFVDTTGKYGTKNDVYLKADWGQATAGSHTYTYYENCSTNEQSMLKKLMPMLWYYVQNERNSWGQLTSNRVLRPTGSDYDNVEWNAYYNSDYADYAIGCAPFEMFADSYNSVSHTTGDPTMSYKTQRWKDYDYVGYECTGKGTYDDYGNVTCDLDYTGYYGMYGGGCGQSEGYWTLGGPKELYWTHGICTMGVDTTSHKMTSVGQSPYAYSNSCYGGPFPLNPVIKLKSSFVPELD